MADPGDPGGVPDSPTSGEPPPPAAGDQASADPASPEQPSPDAAADPRTPSRRSLLGLGAALTGGTGLGLLVNELWSMHTDEQPTVTQTPAPSSDLPEWAQAVEPFNGLHQSGIATEPQAFAVFASFTLAEGAGREELRRLMRLWTGDAERLTDGRPALADTQPQLASPASRLTLTFGVGRGAVRAAGRESEAPAWLAPLPAFSVDKLDPAYGEGDLIVQACAEDPIVLAHAVRTLIVGAQGLASVQWTQRGFRRPATSASSMRNLMGQVDGTVNPSPDEFDDVVWIGGDGPEWLRGGTAFVLRRISMNLDTWDTLDPAAKEEVIGRRLSNGAPLTGSVEGDVPDLSAKNAAGLSVIPEFAHIRQAHATTATERFLRRPYNYDDPPAPGATSDSGLLFTTYQRDPLTSFVPVQQRLAGNDLLNVWTTPVGSAVYALLPGCTAGAYLGEALLT